MKKVHILCYILLFCLLISPLSTVYADEVQNEFTSIMNSSEFSSLWVSNPAGTPSYEAMVRVYTALSNSCSNYIVSTIIADLACQGYLTDSAVSTYISNVKTSLNTNTYATAYGKFNDNNGFDGSKNSTYRAKLGMSSGTYGGSISVYNNFADFLAGNSYEKIFNSYILFLVTYTRQATSDCRTKALSLAPKIFSLLDKIPISDIQSAMVSNTNTIASLYKEGYYTDDDLTAFNRLTERDIQSEILNAAKRDQLTQEQLQGLSGWETNVSFWEREDGLDAFLRRLALAVGIVVIVYACILYICFWFDKINPFFDLSMVSVLTLGKLHTAIDDEDCNYGRSTTSAKDVKFVNHRAMLKVCILCAFCGAVIVSGYLFEFILWLMTGIRKIMGIRG